MAKVQNLMLKTKRYTASAAGSRPPARLAAPSVRVRPALALLGDGVATVQLSGPVPSTTRELEAVRHDEVLLTDTIKAANTVGKNYELLTFAAIKTRNAATRDLRMDRTIRRSALLGPGADLSR